MVEEDPDEEASMIEQEDDQGEEEEEAVGQESDETLDPVYGEAFVEVNHRLIAI